MAKYNFDVSGSQLIISLVPVLDDVQPTSMSYLAPSFKIGVGKINAYEYGQPRQSFLFTEIGEIDGVAPTDLQDAFDKLTTATANFNGGGAAPYKDTTAGVERAYIINADGSQATKATSEFKDVLEFANLASFPVTGETSKIYIALDTNFTYRWSGSAYVQIGGGKRYQTFLFQSSATVILPADQKNLHQSRVNAGTSVFSTLGLTFGNGIPEPAGVLDLSYLSDVGVPNITPNYISKVVNVTLSYSRNVTESDANTNIKLRLISDSKYQMDIQKICEYVITSSTLRHSQEGKVTIPILTHLPLSANSNLKWTVRSNNGVAQQFNILRLNVDIQEI